MLDSYLYSLTLVFNKSTTLNDIDSSLIPVHFRPHEEVHGILLTENGRAKNTPKGKETISVFL